MAPPDKQQGDAVVAAIERVLKTERDGVETLRRSEQQARDHVAQARAQAAAIARRAEACIAKLHGGYLKKIRREVERVTVPAAAPGGATYDAAALAEAARGVAAKLTGGA